ncbi:rhomboid family protein [Chryseobacterium sp. Leaf180]|uniref:DUF6576 domain-containing protein n=1 Tax=Chryseobacterium sp. Leaf180 TaxID=1736289 RepID=UPI0006FEDA9D|nr:DUF6576 domain-containing protein [Chryseobacterium sp. Leaf180]KQR95009.1 rhomboid family protein [Chryseobacterium sp. Leaf180]
MSEILIFLLILILLAGFFYRGKIRAMFFSKQDHNLTIDQAFNVRKREREKEIDHLLSKMGKNGIEDLSPKDRKRLDELSKQ